MHRCIVLPADLKEVPKLNSFVEDVCQTAGLGDADSMQIKVAVEEAVVNVMKYAYPQGHRGDVTIEAASNKLRLKFIIIDCTDLEYISSAGLRIFLGILQNAEDKDGHVYIKNINANVRNIFAITGFSNIFEFV